MAENGNFRIYKKKESCKTILCSYAYAYMYVCMWALFIWKMQLGEQMTVAAGATWQPPREFSLSLSHRRRKKSEIKENKKNKIK